MKPHNIIVDRYKASPDNLELGTYGSYGNENIKFCFKDGWDDTTSVIAIFNSNLEFPTSVVVGEDGTCKVPHEATDFVTSDGKITLVGYKDDARIISLDIGFVVYDHSAVDGHPPENATPDVFQQYLQNVKEIVNNAVPPNGTTGYVLTKTDDGTAWKKPNGGGEWGGESGENGATFTPFVSIDGVISWTNDKDLPNPDPVNIKGPAGPQGKQGEPGEKGDPGEQGPPYALTEEDRSSIIQAVLSALPNGDEVSY